MDLSDKGLWTAAQKCLMPEDVHEALKATRDQALKEGHDMKKLSDAYDNAQFKTKSQTDLENRAWGLLSTIKKPYDYKSDQSDFEHIMANFREIQAKPWPTEKEFMNMVAQHFKIGGLDCAGLLEDLKNFKPAVGYDQGPA